MRKNTQGFSLGLGCPGRDEGVKQNRLGKHWYESMLINTQNASPKANPPKLAKRQNARQTIKHQMQARCWKESLTQEPGAPSLLIKQPLRIPTLNCGFHMEIWSFLPWDSFSPPTDTAISFHMVNWRGSQGRMLHKQKITACIPFHVCAGLHMHA